MALRHRPDLDGRTFEELYSGLPQDLKDGVDRMMWCFKSKLINMPGVDQSAVLDFVLTEEDLKLLYDPILPPELTENLTKEEQTLALASIDPVTWVRSFLRYEPRAYQILMLRGTGRLKAYRAGRRCLPADTMVAMADGSFKPIINIKVGDKLVSRSNRWGQERVIQNTVIETYDNGIKDVYRITFTNGQYIDCTSNHPILTKVPGKTSKTNFGDSRQEWMSDSRRGSKKRWLSIDEGLKVTDKVVVLKKYDKWGNEHNPLLGSLFGYMLTDGYFGADRQTPKFTNNNIRMITEVKEIAKELFGYECSIREKGNGFDIHITDKNHGTQNSFTNLLKNMGLKGIKAQRKELPSQFWTWDKATAMACINRMFSGDGGVSISKASNNRTPCELFLVSTSKTMLLQVQQVLNKIEVSSYINREERIMDPFKKGNIINSVIYKLRISRADSIRTFLKEIGLIFGKEEACREALKACESKKYSLKQNGGRNYCLQTIKSIEYIGKKNTYDISMDGEEDFYEHCFVANGVVVHNTGKTTCMIWEALWWAYTNPKAKIIIISPLEVQIKNMWDMIDDCLLHSGIRPLKAAYEEFSVVSKIRKPWEINFSNGSKIKAFTSGARSGGKADSVRGNEGHLIMVDEMDLMMPDDLLAINAMMQQTSDDWEGDKRLIASSTPNGRRDMFYVFCHRPGVREYWFPSFVSPYFGPDDEEEQRNLNTDIGFIHEIVADWGVQDTGVFKPSILDFVAANSYSYWNGRPFNYKGPIILGVDWDKYGAGVNMMAVAEIDGRIHSIYREEIERSKHEHTLGAGVNRIIELDKVFQFAYIICDRGYGERQWEELVEQIPYGDQRVTGVNYSSSVLETDPVTMKTVKEEFKPFMVDNAVNYYEKKRVVINPDDSKFLAQLLSYVRVRISATGRPVFDSIDPERIGDHALEAWMMALLGYEQHFGEILLPFEHTSPKLLETSNALSDSSTSTKNQTSNNKRKSPLARRPGTSIRRKSSAGIFNRPQI